eukprot:5509224-Amphidinium_carterae.1
MESRESALEAVKTWPFLKKVDEVWKSDHEVVLAAVRAHGSALEFAAEALQGDREIVLTAVQQNGFALEHATDSLRADHEIVLAAVRQNGYALGYATEALRAEGGGGRPYMDLPLPSYA